MVSFGYQFAGMYSAGLNVLQCLQTLEDQTVVFVRTKEGFEARPVKVGRATDDQVEILSGLSSGEQFVAKGVFALKSELKKETLQVHEH